MIVVKPSYACASVNECFLVQFGHYSMKATCVKDIMFTTAVKIFVFVL